MRTPMLALAVVFLFCGIAAADFAVPPYEPPKVDAKVPAYDVEPDLSNIANLKQFGALTPKQKELLAKNAFFVAPADDKQLYFAYENNDYKVIPSFVASDAVLQLYHIFYDYTLREMEAERLIPLAKQLTAHMLEQSLSMYRAIPPGDVQTAALKNVAFFGVASDLLGLSADLPPAAKDMVQKELATIAAHSGRETSAIFGYKFDYSQFIPRGHYTRSEELKRYFRAMMWYGRMPFPLQWPEQPPVVDYEQIRQSLLITRLLYTTDIDGTPAIDVWQRIYEPTAFYVETADDLTPDEWRGAALEVWGHLPTPDELTDTRKLDAFYEVAMGIRAPRIATFPEGAQGLIGIPTGPQFRFMGQRTVPDSYMLQQLVWSYVGGAKKRLWPKGLDILSVLGSERAYEILDDVYRETEYERYDEQMAKLRAEFGAKTDAEWRRNLYWGWVWVFKGLIEPPGAGYPSFMRTEAWLDKELNTALASWAEMRHDTILYVKQSYTAECGDGEPYEEPPIPKGYVEPVPHVYHRLLWLTQATRKGLRDRNLLTDSLGESFGRMEDLLVFIETVSLKELADEPLTAAEYDQIRVLGAELESLTNMVTTAIGGAESGLISETDEDMAVIADVHTASPYCLEEAVGHANHIFVVVPIQGTLYLTRGSIFSYYEFTHPASDRLTDEKWQEMLGTGQASPPPVWTSSFLADRKSELPTPKVPRRAGHGC
ncbi:MAG TPA: DUF3160 domain-containing protein [Armatimonadota bacterium]|nr:DUF3160 domain-containing protein [Armatimonadota bacterium]